MREGADPRRLIELRRHLGQPFDLRRVGSAEFDRLVQDRYALGGSAAGLAQSIGDSDGLDALASGLPTAEDLLASPDDAPAIRLINGILAEAVRAGVSDIHIEPYESGLIVRMRRDGMLKESLRMPAHVAPVVVSRIKVMARLDIAERRIAAGRADRDRARRQLLDVRVRALAERRASA
jgi:general secretion pathway protein E